MYMEEPKFLNLKDIWNSITDIDKNRHQPEEKSLTPKESMKDILTNVIMFDKDGQMQKINNEIFFNKIHRDEEIMKNLNTPSYKWESKLEKTPLQQSNLNNNKSYSFSPCNMDDLNGSKTDNIFRDNRFDFDNYSNDLLSPNLQEGINEKILNTILDNLIESSNQKDFFSKSNVINIINNLLKRKLTRQQYQKIQNVVLAINGNCNNYYTDPLQGFYNQELLMLLLKNQPAANNRNERIVEPQVHKSDPVKSFDQSNASHMSLKDEIAQLSISYRNMLGVLESDIEKAAALYRTSAIAMAQKNEAAYEWSGKLPTTSYKLCQYSRKVFLGGVPWDSSESDLISAFIKFGYLSVMFPQKDLNVNVKHSVSSNSLKGYCYIIFETEDSVNRLLSHCVKNEINNGEFYKISSPKFRSKDVQVIPWMIQDSQYCRQGCQKPDSKKTVFVGALHGMMTAFGLASVMNELFDNVIFTALDTDKYKYPIGSGRVTFSSQKSYMRAVTANFIHIKTAKFSKTIQIDPYLEDSVCNNCIQSPGIYFCRSFECFRYFCSSCWQVWHNRCETLFNHKPLRRTFKPIFDLH